MAVPKKIMFKVCNTKLKLSDLNPHLMCVLCGGYYIDATTIVECLHSFCRSCIVKHLEGSKYCPICEVQVHKTKPLINIRPDKTLQDIVYKLVPGLFASEMQNRREFYQERPHYIKPDDSESVGDLPDIPLFFINGENITFSLIYLDGPSPVRLEERMQELTNVQNELRYFRCPSGVTIQHLKKLLKAKYELRGNNYRIDIFFRDEALIDEYTLLDISYIYLWKTKDNLSLTYKIYEYPAKRRRRRYFGGVDELPAQYTPLSILQSRLGNSAKPSPKEVSEGRRHLRSDMERKKREIESKVQEDRRELRSNDERKRLREKEEDNKNEGKKRFKNKDGKIEKKSKIHDGRRKENKGGDDLKKDPKNHDEKDEEKRKRKKKEKEGKCLDEKEKERDDGEDEDDDREEKDAKDETNREIKKEGERKRKREEDGEEKRKREKREEIKENVADKMEEGQEDVDESNTSREATPATTSEPASASTSDPAAELANTSTSLDESSVSTSAADSTSASISISDPTSISASASTLGSESASEPTSTTNMENEQKADESAMETEESPTSSELTSNRERKSTPPKNNEIKIVQLQITDSGVVRLFPVVNCSKNFVKPPEERACMRVTRRSSITSATPPQDESIVVPQKKKRGPKPKNRTGEEPLKVKPAPKPTKIYKTIRRSPNVWHPSISKEKLRQTLKRDGEESRKPAKFFKLRNRIRMLESQAMKNGTIIEEPEEEEMARREIEKEQAKVEPQPAQVGKRDEVEEGKIAEEELNKDDIKLESGLDEDPKSFGPLDKEDKYSTIVGANAPDLPNNLKGDPNTFGPFDKEDKCSTMVGANAPDLPTNLNDDAKNFGLLDEGDKCSTMGGADIPDLPTNLKGDVKNLGLLDKEDRCPKIIATSAANLLTNPFIPNSNHFLFSDVTLPPNSGNFTKSAEPKLDISVLGPAVAGISGIGSGAFTTPMTNGGSFTPIGFLDPSRLVYSYQTYTAPTTEPVPCTSHLAPFAKVTSFTPVSGFHTTLSPTISTLTSPIQNVQVVSLVKNKDDSTNETMNNCVESLNLNNTEEKEQKKKRKRGRRPAETTVTNLLKKDASIGTKMEIDVKEEEEDEEKIFVPAKRKRDEKGSREKDKKEKGKDDKWEKGEKKRGDEGTA